MEIFITLAMLFGMNGAEAAVPANKGLNPSQLIKRAEDQALGKTFQGKLKMTIKRPDSEREMTVVTWADGHKKAMVKITEPAKDQGIGNLRVDLNLWQYLPKVDRLIKIPPSLMLQSWMGSDFTNDDLVRTSSTSRDYTHTFAGYEKIDGQRVAKIVLTPKPDAPVVWGKLEMWIEPKRAITLRQDYYNEKGELLKRMTGTKVKRFGSHFIASRLEMMNVKKNSSTTLEYLEARFDENLDPNVFNQSFLKTAILTP